MRRSDLLKPGTPLTNRLSSACRSTVHVNMFAILGTLAFFAVFGPSQAALSDEYEKNERLSAQNESDYMLYWTYNKADSTISFAAKAKTAGWVGLGFKTKMDNTTAYDVVRGAYDILAAPDKKKAEINDYNILANGSVVKDLQQDLMNASVTENDGYTTIKFKRALDTKDATDTVIKPGSMVVVWSIGNTENLATDASKMGYKTVTVVQEEQKNDTSTTASPSKTTTGPVSKAAVCRDSWLLVALSALLFMAAVSRP